LSQFLKDEQLSDDEKLEIAAQILISLWMPQLIAGYSHNNLKSSSIFVERLEKPETMSFPYVLMYKGAKKRSRIAPFSSAFKVCLADVEHGTIKDAVSFPGLNTPHFPPPEFALPGSSFSSKVDGYPLSMIFGEVFASKHQQFTRHRDTVSKQVNDVSFKEDHNSKMITGTLLPLFFFEPPICFEPPEETPSEKGEKSINQLVHEKLGSISPLHELMKTSRVEVKAMLQKSSVLHLEFEVPEGPEKKETKMSLGKLIECSANPDPAYRPW
jgi:hypothetical protein